ncbi:MAG TPA: hypothetical protein VIN10_13925 [Bacteroidales bacterium]
MENNKILTSLAKQLEALQKQVLRMNGDNYNLHKLDIEILQNVIRELYEQVLELEVNLEKKPEAQEEKQIPVVPVPEVEKEPEQPEMQAIIEEETDIEMQEIPEPEVETLQEEIEEETIEIPEPEAETPQVVEFEIEVEKGVEMRQEIVEEIVEKVDPEPPVEEIKITETKTVRSTIDLFTTTGEPTIFDRISHDKEPSIADKMRQTRIVDLRQAIGINEKFLFINELFNGDMGKYNKALDELNEMKTKEGVVTYFIELKIHNQWKDDNEAFIKFKELLDRKIE